MRGVAIGLLTAAVVMASCSGGSDGDIVIFGAASLTDVLQAAETQFEAANPDTDVILNLAGSNALREQLRSGADADLFIPADRDLVVEAAEAGDVQGPGVEIARTQLAIAVPAGNPGGVETLEDFSRSELLLGICAAAVPCGRLGRAALESAGVEASVDTDEPDVRALLAKVSAGELDAGLVYSSDVIQDPDVEGVRIPDIHQQSAIYVISPTARANNPAAADDFIAFLGSDRGRSIFEQFGFEAADR